MFVLGRKFGKFFMGTIFSSRAVFKIFSRALANFPGQNLEKFSRGELFFSRGKKNTGRVYVDQKGLSIFLKFDCSN